MKLTFIDTVNGNAFNAAQPYVFWFENGQSTNLNYVKQLCIYSDRNQLTLTIDSPVFSVLKMDQYLSDNTKHPRTVMNKKRYVDLQDLKAGKEDNYSYTYDGYEYHNNFVYLFYILAQSHDAGEFVSEFTISSGENKRTYSVGADFYNINEVLQSNMENLEIKLPESIQRAIYESNLHEESNDNVLLNRKHKELLMNYWDIVANKGSYESLTNSLKWFEWGDLVRIEELWKVKEPQGDIYKLNAFQTQINDELKMKMSVMSKTTYIGLYYAMYHIEHNTQGYTVYEDSYNRDIQKETNRIHVGDKFTNMKGDFNIIGLGGDGPDVIQTTVVDMEHMMLDPDNKKNKVYNEEVPNLLPVVALWNNLDLCLKMTLLGNFYQTFFMPIHMDLLHSTIESWVYANTIKVFNGAMHSRVDMINCINTFELNIDDSQNKIKANKTYTYSDTLFKSSNDTLIKGVELIARTSNLKKEKNDIVDENKKLLENLFNAECGLIHFTGSIPSKTNICREVLRWATKDSSGQWKITGEVDDNTILVPENDNVSLDFNLRFLESEDYILYFEFYTQASIIYTKKVEVEIEDDYRNILSIYRVKPLNLREYTLKDIINKFRLTGLSFNLSDRSEESHRYSSESIFIGSDKDRFILPLSHVIVTPLTHGGRIFIKDKNTTSHEIKLEDILNDSEIQKYFYDRMKNDYWIDIRKRDIITTDNRKFKDVSFLICISKRLYKSVDDKPMYIIEGSYDKDYKEGYVDELRFSPVFYKLEPFEDYNLNRGEVLYIEPTIRHSKYINSEHWEFKNTSLLKSIISQSQPEDDIPDSKHMGVRYNLEPGGKQTTLFTGYNPQPLDPGYYSIILHYKEGEIQQKIQLNSAFLLS